MYATLRNAPSVHQQETLLDTAFATAIDRSFPAAMWRLPNDSKQHLIADLSGRLNRRRPDLEALERGFLVHPFLTGAGEAFFVRADLHYTHDSPLPTLSPEAQRYGASEYNNRERFFERMERPFREARLSDLEVYLGDSEDRAHAGKNAYETLVAEAVSAIKTGRFRKVVTSRTKAVPLPQHFRVASLFRTLCALYPNAFVSVVALPGVGTWVGATPETLISQDAKGIFKTMALAGTQRLPEGEPLESVPWTGKEIEEQALVSRYIINCFKKIRLREFDEEGPRTIRAGHLAHLCTDYTVDTEAVSFPQLGTVMLDLLHPTSAVCGMPKEEALAFLAEREGYDRELYSGYLGPVNFAEGSRLFVNLRCVQILRETALAYAGGGLTAGSVPEKEWRETELKCDITLKALSMA